MWCKAFHKVGMVISGGGGWDQVAADQKLPSVRGRSRTQLGWNWGRTILRVNHEQALWWRLTVWNNNSKEKRLPHLSCLWSLLLIDKTWESWIFFFSNYGPTSSNFTKITGLMNWVRAAMLWGLTVAGTWGSTRECHDYYLTIYVSIYLFK